MHKKYGVELAVKNIEVFDSKNDLTTKNLLILTKSNQVYSLPRKMLSARRCLDHEKESAEKNI